jgi:hypothetical protein
MKRSRLSPSRSALVEIAAEVLASAALLMGIFPACVSFWPFLVPATTKCVNSYAPQIRVRTK